MRNSVDIQTELFGRLLSSTVLPLLLLWRAMGGWGRHDVWLVGENQGEPLDDNGAAFFRYCRHVHPDKPVYLLVKRRWHTFREHAPKDSHIVAYGSLRHMVLYARAGVCFYTHTHRDLMYRRFFEFLGCPAGLVYLHHGTLGFKRFDAFYRRHCNRMDIFTVGSQLEKRLLVEEEGVDAERIHVTGYARSDALSLVDMPAAQQVLYAPTHRRHLNTVDLERFCAALESLLGDPALASLLQEHGASMKVYIHAHTQKTLHRELALPAGIELVAHGSGTLRRLLQGSSLLITDYSSVAWDFLALGKAVVFYRFDLDSYLQARDSYVDLRETTYGPVAADASELLDILERQLESGCAVEPGVLDALGNAPLSGNDACCRRIYELAEHLHK